jgi:hypothetical protein
MSMSEDARAELERKVDAEESAYDGELKRFQRERQGMLGASDRRAGFLAHLLRVRDIGQRLESLYGQINEDTQAWLKERGSK